MCVGWAGGEAAGSAEIGSCALGQASPRAYSPYLRTRCCPSSPIRLPHSAYRQPAAGTVAMHSFFELTNSSERCKKSAVAPSILRLSWSRSFTDAVTRNSIRQNAIDALCPSPTECAAVLFLCAELGECRAVAAAPPASASEFRAAAANYTSGLSSWIDATDHECASFSATLHCGADETAWCSGERRRCSAPAAATDVPLPTWALGMLRQRECLGGPRRIFSRDASTLP